MSADWLINYQFGYINRGLIEHFNPIFNGLTLLNFLTIFSICLFTNFLFLK